MNRGEPIIPSVNDPPWAGMAVMKYEFTFQSKDKLDITRIREKIIKIVFSVKPKDFIIFPK
jgi:hypothetical protein